MKLFDIILENISGDWGNESPQSTSDVEVKCLRSADIVPIYQFDYSGIPFRYVSQKSMEARILHEGDIVIEKSGGTNNCSTGRPIYISGELLENNEPLLCSNFCSAIRLKKDWNPRYVYYYLRLIHKEGLFFNFEGKTSGIHNLDMDAAFKAIDIPEISYPEQEQVAKILSSLDRKIALNRKINAELEQMAKELYDYWFVQFDFPNAEGKPYKSSGGKMVYNPQLKRDIPEGWEVKKIEDCTAILKDGTHNPPKRIKNGVPLLTGQMFGLDFLDYTKATFVSLDDYKQIHSTYHPQNSDFVMTKIGTVGKINYLTNNDLPITIHCNSAILRFIPEMHGLFTYYYLKSELFQLRLNAVLGQSIQEFAGLDVIGSILIETPPSRIIGNFNKMLDTLFSKKIVIRDENKQLTTLRDQLLPLLMNGQVKIK
ncbi:MAG: restriction endonuclease subunit S [Bacteroidales bacterium]|nr:restriction endonuclease subunit S [Bacteroidales bacterium]